MHQANVWVVVLAAGDGKRVLSLTRDGQGMSIPKQFWRFDGKRSLLQATLERARGLAAATRIVPVVAAHHRTWWEKQLRQVPRENVVVQPQNRGTAAGILLPLLHVYRSDPEARIVVLPSDHAVGNEEVLTGALKKALQEASHDPQQLILLGITPDHADSEYGWILPREGGNGARPVAAFIEKPDRSTAEILLASGGLWNSFMFCTRARTLLHLFSEAVPELLWMFLEELADPSDDPARSLRGLYELLPVRDFSRHVLQEEASRLRVLSVPPCGWLDVGTPERLRSWSGRLRATRPEDPMKIPRVAA